MKKYTILFLALLFSFLSFGQCPSTDITLSSQEEIDNFSINYPNCTILTHNLTIDGENNIITNLNGLSLITKAQNILIAYTQIENFYGLDNLENISELTIWVNSKIQNLKGLTALQTIDRLVLLINNDLVNLIGMVNIQSINNINIFGNSSLNDITELNFIETLSSLTIGGNDLYSFSGLENLVNVTGDLIVDNEPIESIDELTNLQTVGSLYVLSNNNLQNLNAFNNIESLENLFVINCNSLPNLTGLTSLNQVNGILRVGLNDNLSTMIGMINIEYVGELEIYDNEKLFTLKGLEYLSKINQRLLINDNPILVSLEHISYVNPDGLDEVVIVSNASLAICNNPLICGVIDNTVVTKYIYNNVPGCNSEEEVELSCMSGLQEGNNNIDNVLENQLVIYPNPVSEILFISVIDNFSYKKAKVHSIYGDKVLETSEKYINFSNLSSGIYFVDIETDQGSVSKKIIKE